MDPLGRVAGVSRVALKTADEHGVENINLNLTQPLLPGSWEVVQQDQGRQPPPSTRFLVLPDLQPDLPDLKENLGIEGSRIVSLKQVISGGESRTAWLQEHVALFYKIVAACSVEDDISELPRCKETSWSSRYIDVSDLANFNFNFN